MFTEKTCNNIRVKPNKTHPRLVQDVKCLNTIEIYLLLRNFNVLCIHNHLIDSLFDFSLIYNNHIIPIACLELQTYILMGTLYFLYYVLHYQIDKRQRFENNSQQSRVPPVHNILLTEQ